MANTKQELDESAKVASAELAEANKAFEALRKAGSAEELVKASNLVVKAANSAKRSRHEADTFELVAVSESIRASVLPLVSKFDMAMLAKHSVNSVTITVPVQSEPVEAEKLTVNTLGKRTVVKSGGNGSRTRYVYGPDKLNSRELVESFGADEVGADKASATLDEPSKYGLTHLADRIAKKLDFDKVPSEAHRREGNYG